MTKPPRVAFTIWRGVLVVTGLLAVVPAAGGQDGQNSDASRQGGTRINAQALALQDFQARIKQYLAMRADAAKELKSLTSAESASDVTTRQASLAAAIRKARAGAKRGDLIPPLVAQLIARTVREDFQRRNPTTKVGVFEEVADNTAGSLINKSYPADAALPTVPPLLLINLPRLPDNLQYRFVGNDMAIMDSDAQVVIDYVPRVLPAH